MWNKYVNGDVKRVNRMIMVWKTTTKHCLVYNTQGEGLSYYSRHICPRHDLIYAPTLPCLCEQCYSEEKLSQQILPFPFKTMDIINYKPGWNLLTSLVITAVQDFSDGRNTLKYCERIWLLFIYTETYRYCITLVKKCSLKWLQISFWLAHFRNRQVQVICWTSWILGVLH